MTAETAERGFRRLPITDDEEVSAVHALLARLDQIPVLITRYEKTAELAPKPSSELGDDDRRTSFLQLSHYVAASMHVATDALSAVAKLLQPEPGALEHRLTAQFPLMRSALEASATALWLLRPDEQRTRIVRLLQLRRSDVLYDLQLAKSAAKVMSSFGKAHVATAQRGVRDATKRKKKHDARLNEIAAAEAIAYEEFLSGSPGLAAIIDEAADDEGKASAVWRVISGLSHPSPLRLLQTSQIEQAADDGNDTVHLLSSMKLQNTIVSLMSAMLLYQEATEMRARRMLKPASHKTA